MECPDYPEELLAAIDAMDDDEHEPFVVSHDAIKRAAKRWQDFVAVTKGKNMEETTQAGYVFATALGLEGEKLDHAVECLKLWSSDEAPTQGTMGLLFGLLIADEANLEREFGDD